MLTRCCCMRLNTFGVVLGWLGVVGSFIGVVLMSVGLSMARSVAEQIAKNMNDAGKSADVDAITNIVVLVCSVYLILYSIGLVSSGLLVIGTVKERHLLLLPWLINAGVSFVISTIIELFLVGSIISNGGTGGDIAKVVIASLIGFVIQFFIIYAIYSLYKQIQASRDQQTPLIGRQGQNGNYPSYSQI